MARKSLEAIIAENPPERKPLEQIIADNPEPPTHRKSVLEEAWHPYVYGLMRGTQSFFQFWDDAAELLSRATGLPKGGMFEQLVELGEPPPEWAPQSFVESVMSGISEAVPEVGLITALPGSAPATMAGMGAIRGGAEEGVEGAAKGAAKGALFGGILKGAQYVRKLLHAPLVGGIFAGNYKAENPDASWEDIAREFGVGFGLSIAGGRPAREIKNEKIRESYEKAKRTMRQRGVDIDEILQNKIQAKDKVRVPKVEYTMKGGKRELKGVKEESGTVAAIDKDGDFAWVRMDKTGRWRKYRVEELDPSLYNIPIRTHRERLDEYVDFLAETSRPDLRVGPKRSLAERVWKQRKPKKGPPQPPAYAIEARMMLDHFRDPDVGRIPLVKGLLPPEYFFTLMGPQMKELFWRPIKEQEFRVVQDVASHMQWAETLFEPFTTKSRYKVGMYGIWQQPKGRAMLRAAGIRKVPKLSDPEKALYKVLRAKYDELYDRINEARRLSGKEPLPKTKDYFTFLNAFGHLNWQRGKVAQKGTNLVNISTKAYKKLVDMFYTEYTAKKTKGGSLYFVHPKVPHFPFAKQRTKAVYVPEVDPKILLNKYVPSAMRHIHLGPAVSKMRELLGPMKSDKPGEMFRPLKKAPFAHDYISRWLDFVTGMVNERELLAKMNPMLERWIKSANRNVTFALLSYNLRSAAIQGSALRNAWMAVPTRHLIKGMASVFKPDNRIRALELSRHLSVRKFDIVLEDLMDSISRGNIRGVKEWTARKGMAMLQASDFITAMMTWEAAFSHGKSQGMSVKRAAGYADDVVIRTQASGARSDVSPAQRSVGGRAVLALQTFIINDFNFFMRQILGYKNTSISRPAAFKRLIKYAVGTALVSAFYEDVLGLTSPFMTPLRTFREAIEQGASIPQALVMGTKEFGEILPVLGGPIRFGTAVGGPLMDLFQDFFESIMVWTGEKKAPTKSFWEMLFKARGVPGTQQFLKSKRAAEHGGTPADIFWGRYVESPKKVRPIPLRPRTLAPRKEKQ